MTQRRKPSPRISGSETGQSTGTAHPPAARQPMLTADTRPNRPRTKRAGDGHSTPPAVTFTDWAMI